MNHVFVNTLFCSSSARRSGRFLNRGKSFFRICYTSPTFILWLGILLKMTFMSNRGVQVAGDNTARNRAAKQEPCPSSSLRGVKWPWWKSQLLHFEGNRECLPERAAFLPPRGCKELSAQAVEMTPVRCPNRGVVLSSAELRLESVVEMKTGLFFSF